MFIRREIYKDLLIFSRDKEYDDFRGAITENYVLNEIIPQTGDVPYYWKSDRGAEADLVVQIDDVVVPIEIKAGNNKSKSLTEYITSYEPKIAVTTALRRNLSSVVKHIPLYALWNIGRYITKLRRG